MFLNTLTLLSVLQPVTSTDKAFMVVRATTDLEAVHTDTTLT